MTLKSLLMRRDNQVSAQLNTANVTQESQIKERVELADRYMKEGLRFAQFYYKSQVFKKKVRWFKRAEEKLDKARVMVHPLPDDNADRKRIINDATDAIVEMATNYRKLEAKEHTANELPPVDQGKPTPEETKLHQKRVDAALKLLLG